MIKNEILASVVKAIKFHFNVNQAEIAEKTGIKETYLSDLIGGRNPLSEGYSDKLSEIFGVNKEYLKSGKGDVFDKSVKQSNVHGDNINGNSVTVNKNGVEVFQMADKVLELIKKKDEQIDRLLSIIEDINR